MSTSDLEKDLEKKLDKKLENYPPLNTLFYLEEKEFGNTRAYFLNFKRKEFDSLEEVVEVVKRRDNRLYEQSYFVPLKNKGEKNLEFVLKEEYRQEFNEEKINEDIENRKRRIKGGFAFYESSLGLTNILKLFYGNENYMLVKLGIDPTKDLHLGHLSVLLKARVLQEMGAPVIIILGDYTATVGDPSGGLKREDKPILEKAREISIDYVRKITNILNPEKTFFVYNSNFHLPDNRVYDLVKVAENFSVSKILEKPIFSGGNFPLSQLLYPLVQALDSVLTGTLIELGGTDQRENLLLTRELQRAYNLEDEALIYETLIIGKDGNKMSKFLNNYISLNSPKEIYSGILSFPDFIETDILKTEIDELKGTKKTSKKLVFFPEYINLCIRKEDCDKNKSPILNDYSRNSEESKHFSEKMLKIFNPLELKIKAAEYICRLLFGEQGAKEGYDFYLKNIKKQGIPEEAIDVKISKLWNKKLADILSECTGLSKSEIRRMSEQNGIKILKDEYGVGKTPLEPNYLNQNIEDFFKNIEQYKINKEYIMLFVGKKLFIRISE
ncbi:MAG: tyrosine--tRNA ligase [Candidatus Woesearchaeota archaeon]